nr:PcfJ domain-containing protein [Neorhizobium tomejilense]
MKAGAKTYNEVGMINGLDLDLPAHQRLRGAIGYAPDVRKALTNLKRMIADVFGNDVVGREVLPPEFRIINAAMAYKAVNKIDHARLILRWPWLYQAFSEHPDILDRAVAGESLWDLIPEEYDEEAVREMRRIRNFSSTWVGGGLTTKVYIKKLVDACACIPSGGQRPTSGEQAGSLINIVDFYDQAFVDFPPPVRRTLKMAAVAKGENWRGGRAFRFGYATDYISYLYRNILLDGFRLLGMVAPPHANLHAAATMLYGVDPERTVEASRNWHASLTGNRAMMDRTYGRREGTPEASSWNSAIDEITAPNGLYIIPLDTADELAKEGHGQRHCVYSQRRDCAEGRQRVASVRQLHDGKYKTLSTFSFRQVEDEIVIREHRAFANGQPSDDAIEAVVWFRDECNSDSPSFRFNTNWTPALRPPEENLRDVILERFEDCKETFPKKLQKGGLEALLAACNG